jgi:hypothetical protein
MRVDIPVRNESMEMPVFAAAIGFADACAAADSHCKTNHARIDPGRTGRTRARKVEGEKCAEEGQQWVSADGISLVASACCCSASDAAGNCTGQTGSERAGSMREQSRLGGHGIWRGGGRVIGLLLGR